VAPKRRGVKVEFEWGWGISFALLGTALYAVYFFFGDPSVRDAIRFFLTLLASLVTVHAAISALHNYKDTIETDKISATLALLAKMEEPHFIHARSVVHEFEERSHKNSTSVDDRFQKFLSDPELYKSIVTIAGYFEDMAIGVENDYYDEKVLYASVNFSVCREHDFLDPIHQKLKEYRKTLAQTSQTKSMADELCAHFSRLAKAWQDKKSLATGKKFAEVQEG
jgi:hypothetical protein